MGYNADGTYMPNRVAKRIRSFELVNTHEQEIEVHYFRSVLDIQAQGEDIYMFCNTGSPPPGKPGSFESPIIHHVPTTVQVWIVRTDQSFDGEGQIKVDGIYAKTIIIKDIAYHFYCNHIVNPR